MVKFLASHSSKSAQNTLTSRQIRPVVKVVKVVKVPHFRAQPDINLTRLWTNTGSHATVIAVVAHTASAIHKPKGGMG